MKRLMYLFLITISMTNLLSCSRSGKKGNQKEKETKSVKVPVQLESNAKTETLQELYEKNKISVFLIYTSDGEKYHQGSGFFISNEGLCVSNYHVFAGSLKGQEIIKTSDGEEYKISEVISFSKELDYITFKIENKNGQVFPFLKITQKLPMVGENVFAIGNPKGLESTLSTGIVSAFRDDKKIIQTTSEITHGSSGGPLFNMRGEVIGITSSGMGEANLNFAINILAINLER